MNIQNFQKPYFIEFLGTPESGKTTTIHRINDELSKKYKTCIIQESAELAPEQIPKGSLEIHFWMRMNTAKNILEMQFRNDIDFVLVDRGIIDALFWDYYFCETGRMSPQLATNCNTFLQNVGVHYPNLIVLLTTTPEEAIRRRGGEGTLVKLDFLERFNRVLKAYIETVNQSVLQLDTTELSQDTVFKTIINQIPTPENPS